MDKTIDKSALFSFKIAHWHLFQNGIGLWISLGIAVLVFSLAIISISAVIVRLNSKLIQTRTVIKVLFAWLIASFLLQIGSGNWWYVHPILLFVPLSLFISIFIDKQKKNIYLDIAILSFMALDIFQLYYHQYA